MRLVHVLSFAALTTTFGVALGVGCSDDPVNGAGASSGAGISTGTSSGGAGGMTGSGGTASTGIFTSGTGGTGGTGTGTGGTGTGVGGAPTDIATCQGHTYDCGDLVDNDGDGLIDSQDPDCLGPCDNTEGSYYGGIPGQAGPACTVDCYFDSNSGSGNDGCYWNHKCDPHESAPDYHPESNNGASCAYDPNAHTAGTNSTCAQLSQTQSGMCHTSCGPLTPNGCDCFGCCELPAGSGKYVWLGSDADDTGMGSCTRDSVNDPTRCEPCQPVAGCLNPCGVCELCLGKDTLPPECFQDGGMGSGGGSSGSGGGATTTTSGSSSSSSSGGGTGSQCSPDVQPCGLVGQAPCPADYYCITGCCVPIPK